MPMREECKHFQSRTYASGEVARFCSLDLAPDAPWKCPDNCPSYEPRLADVGWGHGSLVEPPMESMPDVPDEEAATLLDQAEDIINTVGPDVLAEVEAERLRSERSSSRKRWWRRKN
jgi:hypothetical protein